MPTTSRSRTVANAIGRHGRQTGPLGTAHQYAGGVVSDNPYRLPRTASPSPLRPHARARPGGGHVHRARVDVDGRGAPSRSTELVLNAVELEIDEAGSTVGDGDAPRRRRRRSTSDTERLHARPARAAGSRAPATVHLALPRHPQRQAAGLLPLAPSPTTTAPSQVIATTQFEATDARRAFPCWDEPDFKAVFAVTLVVADDLLAVSNAAEVGREPRRRRPGRASRFADTMTMSTYLVAFVVGPLEATEPVDVDGMPLRVVHVPGQGPPHRLRPRGRRVLACAASSRLLRHPLPRRQARPGRRARLRLRRHGEPRLRHVPRGAAARRPRRRPPRPSCSGSPTSSPTSWPTCGSATS